MIYGGSAYSLEGIEEYSVKNFNAGDIKVKREGDNTGYYKDPDQENGCGEDCEVELILDQFPIDTLFSYDDCRRIPG